MIRSYYIYELIDPRNNEVKYVGKTINPKKRLTKHIERSKRKNLRSKRLTHKEAWIIGILNVGMTPKIKVVFEVESNEEANVREIEHIIKCRELGCKLTNGTDGGDGNNLKPNSTSFKKGNEPWNKGLKLPKGYMGTVVGSIRTEGHKENLSNSIKAGFKNGREVWNKGRKLSPEEIQAIRDCNPNKKSIIMIDEDGNEFDFVSLGDAARFIKNDNPSWRGAGANIAKATQTGWASYGFKWRYKQAT